MRKIELKDFARRVEHVCDFFLSKIEADGSKDRKVLEDLKEDAADIQFDQVEVDSGPFIGLDDYLKGVVEAPEPVEGRGQVESFSRDAPGRWYRGYDRNYCSSMPRYFEDGRSPG